MYKSIFYWPAISHGKPVNKQFTHWEIGTMLNSDLTVLQVCTFHTCVHLSFLTNEIQTIPCGGSSVTSFFCYFLDKARGWNCGEHADCWGRFASNCARFWVTVWLPTAISYDFSQTNMFTSIPKVQRSSKYALMRNPLHLVAAVFHPSVFLITKQSSFWHVFLAYLFLRSINIQKDDVASAFHRQ